MSLLTGVRLLIFAIVSIACLTYLAVDTAIDGAQFLTAFGLVWTIIGGKEYLQYKNLQTGGKP